MRTWGCLAFPLMLVSLTGPAGTTQRDAPRPNVLLILADDLGYETLGCNGGTSYATPNLDALAASGVRFTNAHATPLCTPSRVQLMTGQYSFRNYEAFGFLRAGERTFASLLGEASYDTCVVGKWQLCGNPQRRERLGLTGQTPAEAGFDRWCLWQLLDVGGSRYRDPVLSIDTLEMQELPGEYGPDVFARYATEFMAAERERPFLVYYPMVLTHAPFEPTPASADWPSGPKGPQRFGESVAYMDAVVGRLLRALEETGQRDDTLVIFLGDNGTDRSVTSRVGERGVRGRKGHTVSAGTHVPLIVSWPGVAPAGRVAHDLVDLTDILPTVLAAAGVDPPADLVLDGHDLGRSLRGETPSPREWIFCDYFPRWGRFEARRWVHDERYKLYAHGELYDLVADPDERSPIPVAARDAPTLETVERLRAVLARLRPEPARRRPNVVVILTDDQGSADMGAYGARDLETPAMDRLAAGGVRFTQFYASAPVCSPSRAALLTGLSPQAAGVPGNVAPGPGAGLPPERMTMAEVFGAAGYRTALVGKWHLGSDAEHRPDAQGFEHWFGHLGGCIDNWSHFFYWNGPNRHDLWRDGEEVFADGTHFLDLCLDEARAFVRESADEPFFLYWALNTPHYPYQGDAATLARYRERGTPYPRDLYGAFLTSADARIGALLVELERLELTRDTIVVLQSDHGHSTEVRAHGGGGSAGPLRGAKFSLFEGGLRVPAVIAWPGQLPPGEVRGQPALAVDWLPTLVDLCGLDPLEHAIAGKSLAPLLRDPTLPPPHAALHWQRGQRWAVRRGDWKLLHDPHDTSAGSNPPPNAPEDVIFLANLAHDPGERLNRAADEPALVRELTALHDAWVANGY